MENNQQRRPVGLSILALLLVLLAINYLFGLFRTNSVDIQLLQSYNISLVVYVYLLLAIALCFVLAHAYWFAKKYAYMLTKLFIGIEIVYLFLVSSIGLSNNKILVAAILKSRLDRGLSTEGVGVIANPFGFIGLNVIYIILFLFLGYYVKSKKDYFTNN